MPTVIEILKDWLREHNYDGLHDPDRECACYLDDENGIVTCFVAGFDPWMCEPFRDKARRKTRAKQEHADELIQKRKEERHD